MKYRLGLDLGTGSVGSAIVELDEQGNAIKLIDAGSRIFEVSEGAADRRLYRFMRKNLKRRRMRLQLLAKKLFENGLWVSEDPSGTKKMRSVSPYFIRNEALSSKLQNCNYIGRALLHMAKHRGAGYLAEDEDDKNARNGSSPYDRMAEHVREFETVGAYLWSRLENKESVRQKQTNPVDYAIPRFLLRKEFEKIWDKQSEFFEQMNKPGLKEEIYNILFFERAPMPWATGKCPFYTDEDRLLKADLLSEERRIYEAVNNIRFFPSDKLSIEERDKIIDELLMKGKSAGSKNIGKLLNEKRALNLEQPIKPYLYSTEEFTNSCIASLSVEEQNDFFRFLANPVNPDDKNGRLYNEEQQILKIQRDYCPMDEQKIGELLRKIPKGRAALGASATEKILEKLKGSVISVREATDELMEEDERFRAAEEFARENQGTFDELPYYGEILRYDVQPIPPTVLRNSSSISNDERKYGRVANPAVHMILNQVRKVVNEIIKIYGKPYEINVELARDVGMSPEKKAREIRKQNEGRKKKEEAVNYFKDRNMRVNRTNIRKYSLAKEQNFVDMYNPSEKIPQDFSGMDIDHIIAQELGGSDQMDNICLTSSANNRAKDKMLPYDFVQSRQNSNDIMMSINEIYKGWPEKLGRFREDAKDHEEYFKNDRDLTDTRYVSKLAFRYLRSIVDCNETNRTQTRVFPLVGKHTFELRKIWGLDGIEYDLFGMGAKYSEDDPRERKPRIDHRHHALDAIVAASVNGRTLFHTYNKLIKDESNSDYEYSRNDAFNESFPALPLKKSKDLRNLILDKLRQIKVSHKLDHSKQGQLHKETIRTVAWEEKSKTFTVYSRKIRGAFKKFTDLDHLLVSEKIKDEWNPEIADIRQAQAQLKEDIESYLDEAKFNLEEENLKKVEEGYSVEDITEAKQIEEAFRLVKSAGLWKSDSYRCYEENNANALVIIGKRKKMAYEGENNHTVDFFEKEDGKVGWEVIKRFDANRKDFKPQWLQSGFKSIWHLHKGDLLELDCPAEWKGYTEADRCLARVRKFYDGKIAIDYIADARRTSPPKNSPEYMKVNSLEKGLAFYTEHGARKIELTPFGKVKRKHKKLWNGKKK